MITSIHGDMEYGLMVIVSIPNNVVKGLTIEKEDYSREGLRRITVRFHYKVLRVKTSRIRGVF